MVVDGAVFESELQLPSNSAMLPSSMHVLASIADPGAGPSHSVTALATAMARRGARVGLHSVAGWRDDGQEFSVGVSHTTYRHDFAGVPLIGAVCLSGELNRGLRQLARTTDILHAHGLWLMPNVYPAWVARTGRARLVISPRGMLAAEALAFSRFKKGAFWRLYQARALREAACLHATSESEYADIRAAGLANPVAVIANGVDLPAEPADTDQPRTVLSLGRIHPKKGLDSLIRAWARVEAAHPDWRLRIVGPAELGHDRELSALGASLGVRRLSIEGPAFGAARLAAYHAADLFVLPTRNDNFAMTVAEALAAGLPVISTKGAPWSGLEHEGCGWWIDHGPDPMAVALDLALGLPRATLRAMGASGRAWMARDFSWDHIAETMLDVYAWLARGASAPSFVRFD